MGGNGKAFIGNYDIRGCHAQGRFAYYGIDWKEKDSHRKFLIKPFYRPNGYDCGK